MKLAVVIVRREGGGIGVARKVRRGTHYNKIIKACQGCFHEVSMDDKEFDNSSPINCLLLNNTPML